MKRKCDRTLLVGGPALLAVLALARAGVDAAVALVRVPLVHRYPDADLVADLE